MSSPQKSTITCPNCRKRYKETIWASVNTDLSPDLPERIITGAFFHTVCPHCSNQTTIHYDMLYNDMKHQAWVWLVHLDQREDPEKAMKEIREVLLPRGVETRLVTNLDQLRDKVSVLEAGLDDRVVEICKLFMEEQLWEQNPDFHAYFVMFNYLDGENYIRFFDETGKEIHYILDRRMYDIVEEEYRDALGSLPQERYPIYDKVWAIEFLNSLQEGN